MAHADVCPCKHGISVCEEHCRACFVEWWGEETADHIIGCDPHPIDRIPREGIGPIVLRFMDDGVDVRWPETRGARDNLIHLQAGSEIALMAAGDLSFPGDYRVVVRVERQDS